MSRRRFTRETIARVRGGPGVYKLYAKYAKKPTYIGSSEDLRERLVEQRRNHRYATFKVHHTNSTSDAREKERRMILLNDPRRNKQLPP